METDAGFGEGGGCPPPQLGPARTPRRTPPRWGGGLRPKGAETWRTHGSPPLPFGGHSSSPTGDGRGGASPPAPTQPPPPRNGPPKPEAEHPAVHRGGRGRTWGVIPMGGGGGAACTPAHITCQISAPPGPHPQITPQNIWENPLDPPPPPLHHPSQGDTHWCGSVGAGWVPRGGPGRAGGAPRLGVPQLLPGGLGPLVQGPRSSWPGGPQPRGSPTLPGTTAGAEVLCKKKCPFLRKNKK